MLTALAIGIALLAPTMSALAADRDVKLTLDGRLVDRAGGVALVRNGVVYADVVPLVKSFDGLLTFQGNAVVVSIHGVTGRFTDGSRTALINDGAVTMRGQTFKRNGNWYVPLVTFITQVAKAKVRVNAAQTQADIVVNS
jgi:copper amine oxidase-like protein